MRSPDRLCSREEGKLCYYSVDALSTIFLLLCLASYFFHFIFAYPGRFICVFLCSNHLSATYSQQVRSTCSFFFVPFASCFISETLSYSCSVLSAVRYYFSGDVLVVLSYPVRWAVSYGGLLFLGYKQTSLCFQASYCPAKRGSRAGASRNEFDYSRRGT